MRTFCRGNILFVPNNKSYRLTISDKIVFNVSANQKQTLPMEVFFFLPDEDEMKTSQTSFLQCSVPTSPEVSEEMVKM